MLRYFPIEGRLIFTDDTEEPPHVVFDTDDAMLCVKPDHFFAGSQVVPARTASSSGVNGTQTVVDVETDYYIATIDIPGTKVVRGMIRTTWDSNPEPADNLWRQASGSHLDLIDGVNVTSVPQDDLAGYNRVASIGAYTFYVNDLNHLVLKERLVVRCRDSGNPPTNYNRIRRECTVSFRLLVGFFLQSDFVQRPGATIRAVRSSDTNATALNFTVNPGYDFTGRRMLGLVYGARTGTSTGQAPTSVRVIGAADSVLGGISGVSGNQCSITLAERVFSGSSDGTIGATWSNNVDYFGYHLLALGNLTNATPTIVTNSANGASSVSVTFSLAPNQYAIVGAVNRASGAHPICTWTNAVKLGPDITARTEFNFGASCAVVRGGPSGNVTVTANWSHSGNLAILAARYE